MVEVIFYNTKPVVPRGLNQEAKPDYEKVQEQLFSNHYQNLHLLESVHIPIQPSTLFYPGCGVDILTPLLYIEKLFPTLPSIHFILNDIDDNRTMIQSILDTVGIQFDDRMQFYWNNMFVTLTFLQGDIRDILPKVEFDLYFERAFRIMRDQIDNYEQMVMEQLTPNGILISDSGFENVPLQTIPVPKQLSSYHEMIMGVKK